MWLGILCTSKVVLQGWHPRHPAMYMMIESLLVFTIIVDMCSYIFIQTHLVIIIGVHLGIVSFETMWYML